MRERGGVVVGTCDEKDREAERASVYMLRLRPSRPYCKHGASLNQIAETHHHSHPPSTLLYWTGPGNSDLQAFHRHLRQPRAAPRAQTACAPAAEPPVPLRSGLLLPLPHPSPRPHPYPRLRPQSPQHPRLCWPHSRRAQRRRCSMPLRGSIYPRVRLCLHPNWMFWLRQPRGIVARRERRQGELRVSGA